MKNNIRYGVKKIYSENPWEQGRGAFVEGRKEEEGSNQKELHEKVCSILQSFGNIFLWCIKNIWFLKQFSASVTQNSIR